MRMFGPVLEGRVARLRPPREADLAVVMLWFEDLEVTRTLAAVLAPSEAGEREWFERAGKAQNQVSWLIEHEGRPVGTTGIVGIDWVNQRGSTGIVLDRAAWGKGIATEVMQLRTAFAFEQLNLHKLSSSYLDGNEASARAQARAGYREIGRLRDHFFRDGRWLDEIITEVLREDWLRSR